MCACVRACVCVFLCLSVFDDGDEKTLRRTSLCLKGERHFAESEVNVSHRQRDYFPSLYPSTRVKSFLFEWRQTLHTWSWYTSLQKNFDWHLTVETFQPEEGVADAGQTNKRLKTHFIFKTRSLSMNCLKMLSSLPLSCPQTLDQLPLTNPEHFGTPVIGKKSNRGGRRSSQAV